MSCFISYWKETNQTCQNGARKDGVQYHSSGIETNVLFKMINEKIQM